MNQLTAFYFPLYIIEEDVEIIKYYKNIIVNIRVEPIDI